MSYYVILEGHYLATYELFETREEAQARANCCRPYWRIAEATWWQREQCRLNNGTYTPPPWDLWEVSDHWAHVSKEDPTQIAFTENEAKGERDIQTRMRPGRYLARYYPSLTPQQVEAYAEWFRTGQQPPPPDQGPLVFSTDFVSVYSNGPGSCMKGHECVRVYDAGDLQIAHVGQISRALVWPDRKIFGRVYSVNHDAEQDLVYKLRNLGYNSLDESEVGFHGARILKIPESGTFVMPYMDRGYGVKDAGDHFVMSLDYEYPCDRTSGYLGDVVELLNCGHCGTEFPENESYMVWREWPNTHEILVCSHCNQNHYRSTDYGRIPITVPVTITVDGCTPTEVLADHYTKLSDERWVPNHCVVHRQDGTLLYRFDRFVCPETGREEYYGWGFEIEGVYYTRNSRRAREALQAAA